MQAAAGVVEKKKKKKITWNIKYLYDGDCPMCNSLKTVLERKVCAFVCVCLCNSLKMVLGQKVCAFVFVRACVTP